MATSLIPGVQCPCGNQSNLYMPGNFQICLRIQETTGDCVANLHDADVFDPTLLEKWERALNEHPTTGFVFCGVSTGSHDGHSVTAARCR